MKRLLFLLAVVSLYSCQKKNTYTCECLDPHGTIVETRKIEAKSLTDGSVECNTREVQWNAAGSYYLGTQCIIR